MQNSNELASAGSFSFTAFWKMQYAAYLIVLAVIFSIQAKPSAAVDADSGQVKTDSLSGRLVIRIETGDSLPQGQFDTIDVTIDAPAPPIAGFTFKIATTSDEIEIVHIIQGTLLDSCDWEYFTASPLTDDNIRPTSVWRLTGLAKFSADTVRPACLSLSSRSTLARIIVAGRSSMVSGVDAFSAPLFFFWEDCRDNTISDVGGGQLFVSERVIDYVPAEWPSSLRQFPNKTGAPSSCISPKAINAPKRLIEFHNGGFFGSGNKIE